MGSGDGLVAIPAIPVKTTNAARIVQWGKTDASLYFDGQQRR
jgi:hypothetical protein